MDRITRVGEEREWAYVEGRHIALEEFPREMVMTEEMHAAEVDKMLRKPAQLATAPRAAN